MEKTRYMISEAAEIVQVETHGLRYWEEEMGMVIPRNEMGHRYYTRENIRDFLRIKELKNQGYQLKAIRMLLKVGQEEVKGTELTKGTEGINYVRENPQGERKDRMVEFRELMGDIVAQALAKNNEALSKSVGQEVKEQVLKEMNYLMREQDELQEERFRQLDAAIRGGIKRSKFTEKKEKIRKRNSHTL